MQFFGSSLVPGSRLGGAQRDAKVAVLANGDQIIVWRDAQLNKVLLARLDGFGAQIGTVLDVTGTASASALFDIELTRSGRLFIAYSNPETANAVAVAQWNPDTGLVTTTTSVAFHPTDPVAGAQLVPRFSTSIRIIASREDLPDNSATHYTAVVGANGSITEAPSEFLNLGGSGRILEAVEGDSDTRALFITSTDWILSTSGAGLQNVTSQNGSRADIVRIEPGFYLMTDTPGQNNVNFRSVLTFATDPGSISGAAGSVSPGTVTSGTVGARDMVHLGNGNVLVVWATDSTSSNGRGLFARIFNVETYATSALLTLSTLSNVANIALADVQARLMPDGRVSVVFVEHKGLTETNVYTGIIDPRNSGIRVVGTAGADRFVGTDQDDYFDEIDTPDIVVGGFGTDTIRFAGNTVARAVDLLNPARFPEGLVLFSSIENLTGRSGNDTFFGNNQANILLGEGGSDLLYGRGGNDSLDGGNANDTIFGGANDDTISGGASADRLSGDSGNDLIFGGSGADVIRGGAGADTIHGGSEDDVIFGGLDSDELHGDAGNDTIRTGTGDDTVFGGDGNDLIIAIGSNNEIFGGAGDDRIRLSVGDGYVDGGDGIDQLGFASSIFGLHIDLMNDYSQFAADAGMPDSALVVVDIENVTGTAGSDFLAGTDGANVLRGGAGNDTILMRGGDDTIFGGPGADVFIFDRADIGNNRIRDFTPGVDRLWFASGVFGDIDAHNIDSRFVFDAVPSATLAGAQFLYDNAGSGAGRLFFDPDGTGSTPAQLIAVLRFTVPNGAAQFSTLDFEIV